MLEPWVDADWLAEWDGDFWRLNFRDESEQAFPDKSDAFAAGVEVDHYAARVVEAGGTVGDGPPSS